MTASRMTGATEPKHRSVRETESRLDMPAYREAFVNNQDLADIYAYLLTIKPAPTAKEIPLLNFSENARRTK